LGLETTADSEGRFELSGVPPARPFEMRITADWQSHVREEQLVDIPPEGGVVDVGEVKLHPGKLDFLSPRAGLTGLVPVTRNGRVVVQSLRAGYPAEKAGARAGDLILAVGETDTSHAGASTVNFLLRGDAGASVTLLLQTPGAGPREVTFVRVLH
jgi:membrane-associated protease RseP (regulator of RpoE activity)